MSAMELDGAPPATNESDDDEEQFVAAREFTAAEREEAERLHRTAVRAEALAAAQSAAKERGVALSNEEKDKIVWKMSDADRSGPDTAQLLHGVSTEQVNTIEGPFM